MMSTSSNNFVSPLVAPEIYRSGNRLDPLLAKTLCQDSKLPTMPRAETFLKDANYRSDFQERLPSSTWPATHRSCTRTTEALAERALALATFNALAGIRDVVSRRPRLVQTLENVELVLRG